MLLPSRNGSSDSYRYGFNGKEKDDEVKGEGVQYDYGFRIYDARIGKFLSVDPLTKEYPWYTPYQFAGNTPIQANDLDGLEEIHYTLVYDRENETTTLKYSHSVDIIVKTKVLVIDRQATQWMDPGEYHYEERVEINPTKRFVLDIYDPSYGQGRENRKETYGDRVARASEKFKGASTMSDAGAMYAYAYSMDAYDYGAAVGGKNELSNAEKDEVDFQTFALLLEAIPVAKILGRLIKVPGFTVRSSKFDYFFGRVTSEGNKIRSMQNLKDLTTLGIKSESKLLRYFDEALKNGKQVGDKLVNKHGTTIKKRIQVGDKGAIDVSFLYRNGDMNSIPEVTTIIPKIAKQ